jgi:predicted ribosome quality control (RQC) complex YloA/Tae2 family protein
LSKELSLDDLTDSFVAKLLEAQKTLKEERERKEKLEHTCQKQKIYIEELEKDLEDFCDFFQRQTNDMLIQHKHHLPTLKMKNIWSEYGNRHEHKIQYLINLSAQMRVKLNNICTRLGPYNM